MNTFHAYQNIAVGVPVPWRNDDSRLRLPVVGLREEAGTIGSLVSTYLISGKLALIEAQSEGLKNRMGDVLWYLRVLSNDTGNTLQDLAAHSTVQLRLREKGREPDRR